MSPTLNIKIRFYFFTFIVVPFRNWKLGTDLDRGRSKANICMQAIISCEVSSLNMFSLSASSKTTTDPTLELVIITSDPVRRGRGGNV